MAKDLTQQPDIHLRTVTPGTPLHAGTLVYRVIEIDPRPDVYEPHSWEAGGMSVERASDKQIKLSRPFQGLPRTVFEPTAFGRLFFDTPLQAIQHFLTECRQEVEPLARKKREAERAIVWAERQGS